MDITAQNAPVVLCVAGSPRSCGNSARLLEACISGIRGAGGREDLLTLATAPVPGCTGCHECNASGACVLLDSMTSVYERIDAADAIVIASPVYFATVPAPLKAFLDRCQPYWARRYLLGQAAPATARPGALLLVRGGGDPYGSDCAVAPVKSAFSVLGVRLLELLEVEGPDAAGDIEQYPETLQRAEEIGAGIVSAVLASR